MKHLITKILLFLFAISSIGYSTWAGLFTSTGVNYIIVEGFKAGNHEFIGDLNNLPVRQKDSNFFGDIVYDRMISIGNSVQTSDGFTYTTLYAYSNKQLVPIAKGLPNVFYSKYQRMNFQNHQLAIFRTGTDKIEGIYGPNTISSMDPSYIEKHFVQSILSNQNENNLKFLNIFERWVKDDEYEEVHNGTLNLRTVPLKTEENERELKRHLISVKNNTEDLNPEFEKGIYIIKSWVDNHFGYMYRSIFVTKRTEDYKINFHGGWTYIFDKKDIINILQKGKIENDGRDFELVEFISIEELQKFYKIAEKIDSNYDKLNKEVWDRKIIP